MLWFRKSKNLALQVRHLRAVFRANATADLMSLVDGGFASSLRGAQAHQRRTCRQARQPCTELSALLVVPERLRQSDKDIVDHILRVGLRTRESPRHREELARELIVQRAKSVGFAEASGRDQSMPGSGQSRVHRKRRGEQGARRAHVGNVTRWRNVTGLPKMFSRLSEPRTPRAMSSGRLVQRAMDG